MNCPNCGELINDGQKFCAKCGTPAPTPAANSVFCPNCGTKVEGGAFCPSCGTPVQASAPAQPAYAAPAQPAYSAPAQPMYTAPAQPAYAAPTYAAPAAPAAPVKPGYKSLSIVVKGPLTTLAIILMFVSGFFTYRYYYGDYGYYIDSSFAYLTDVWPTIIAIAFLTVSLVMSFVRLFSKSRKLGWVGFAFATATFLLVLITAIVYSEEFGYSSGGYYAGGYYYSYYVPKSGERFTEFGTMFYIELLVLASNVVMSIFDGLKKPLIKIGK